MKSPIFRLVMLFLFAFSLTGCKSEQCVTRHFEVVNRIESDIVVELKFGDKQTATIHSGDTKLMYISVRCYEEGVESSMVPEILGVEIMVNEETLSFVIQWPEYWNRDPDDTYTLTITEEFLESLRA